MWILETNNLHPLTGEIDALNRTKAQLTPTWPNA